MTMPFSGTPRSSAARNGRCASAPGQRRPPRRAAARSASAVRSRPRAASPASIAASVALASPCRPSVARRCRCSWSASMSTRISAPREVRGGRAGRVEVVGLGELGADGEHDVGLGEGRVHGPQRERRADAQRVAVGQHALGVDRQADRRPEPLGDRGGLGARGDGAAAEQQHRALGGGQQLDGALDQGAVGPRRRAAGRQPLPRGGGQVEHVDRDADVHRARPARLEDLEGAGEGLGQVGRIAHLDRVGGDRRHERALVGQVVERAVPAAVVGARGGARDDEHRDRVVVGARDRRRGVRQAGAGDQRAHAGLAGDARVAVGHERRALLVTGRDVADVGRREAAVDLERVHARDAEHGVDVVLLEEADDRLSAARRAGGRGAARCGSKWRGFGHGESV